MIGTLNLRQVVFNAVIQFTGKETVFARSEFHHPATVKIVVWDGVLGRCGMTSSVATQPEGMIGAFAYEFLMRAVNWCGLGLKWGAASDRKYFLYFPIFFNDVLFDLFDLLIHLRHQMVIIDSGQIDAYVHQCA